MNKRKIIFVACDTSNINRVKRILRDTQTNKLKIIPKFGLQFFYSQKMEEGLLENLRDLIFLDLKIKDTSNTAISAIDSIKDLKGCKYTTIHVDGGLKMMH